MDIKPNLEFSKDEVAYLVELIQSYNVLTSKETKAATNKLKEDAWISLTAAFNAKCGSIPKQKKQLKLMWDNLKKTACKRYQQIRMNNLKMQTGGGKPEFIPPDEILEKVVTILGATCTGFEVPFGGDGVLRSRTFLELDNNITRNTSGVKKRKINVDDEENGNSVGGVGAKCLYRMPTMAKSLQNKGKKKKIEDGRLEKNLAIANYYNKKAEKLYLEIKMLKLQLANKENNNN